ncbi:MAG: glycosyltransferase family 4 protein [Gammaproteobacteria bacterium]|nr:glycosyltransferase family 4 protein [Rhodocyclaceae bacterium]MBU3910518.1 glycosyltransferase family 4 protein [Gammaproteobacteria bacterium]MBU3989580.1 glycosyltransferase family 4 protein [Gammaproteobacteria bacterium]MBU4004999.1 glycosyltransferase family 4 protein [Gammaproteobacteria bacterium]MBU4020592.1 glycosyltransferase family 4 protein [Gammaproteobacteria bacterium]
MRLLVVSQYFWPENFRINDLVADMAARGHEVTVLTGQPNYPSGRFFPGYGWTRPHIENYQGTRVVRVPLVPRGSAGAIRLALNYISFAFFGAVGVWLRLQGKFDAVFVFEVSPVTVGIPAIAAGRRFKAPVLFWVLDLWPESLTAAGAVKSPMVLRTVDRLVKWIYRNCARVLVQSRAFVPEIARHGVPDANILYFPSWGESLFQPFQQADATLLPPLPAGFTVLFAGNLGEAQDLPAVLRAAELLRDRADIHWLLVGDGRMAAWAKAEVQRRGLSQVHFLGRHPLESMPHFYAAADALLLPLKREHIFALTIPGKLQSYLACARPVLAMLDGEGAHIVEEAGAGLACPAGDADGLAAQVLRMAATPETERRAMGLNGRKYYEVHFDRTRLFDQLETWLEDAIQESKHSK